MKARTVRYDDKYNYIVIDGVANRTELLKTFGDIVKVSYTDGETHLVMKNEDVKTMLERIQKEESKTAAEKFYDKAIELVSKEHLTKEKAVVMVMEKYPDLYIAFKKEKYAEEKGV